MQNILIADDRPAWMKDEDRVMVLVNYLRTRIGYDCINDLLL
ncbi:hypothetical protein MGA3_11975 [Bacillus methanolicus MGA3]|uniref:Uncharacterized protein n=1 Tax=Bacillus methanolicus (strain MGA3 / ATCC 53907) TaxID=796606 RepID=I3E3D5_BACMM|nr:hypothetical protein BMMGA3_02220 [Bacillus methanolicus MGA3]EIJ81006.1 hypothetical protein MGA3_11975 [Bacillus methanolicus MGA3]